MVLTALDIIKRKAFVLAEEIDVGERMKNVKQKTYSNSTNEKYDQYAMKLITDEEWGIISEEDMECYNNYIERVFDKRVEIYLYSIMDNVLQKL